MMKPTSKHRVMNSSGRLPAAVVTVLAVSLCIHASTVRGDDAQYEVFKGTFIERIMGGGPAPSLSGKGEAPPEIWPKQPAKELHQSIKGEPPKSSRDETLKFDEKALDVPPPEEPVIVDIPEKAGSESAQQPPEQNGGVLFDPAELMKQGGELAKRDDHSGALQKYRAALKKASRPEDRKLQGAALSGAAAAAYQLGRNGEAAAYVNRAIAVHLDLKNAHARSLNFVLLGRIQMAQSQYSAALKSFEEAQKILPTSESAELPGLLEHTAVCQLRSDRYQDALGTFNRLLALHAKDKNDLETARLSLVIGEVQVSRSDYRGARVNFKRAEKIYRDLKRAQEAGETLFRIAYLDQMEGDLKAARKASEEGQALLKGKTDAAGGALPLMVRGMEAYNEGKVAQAIRTLTSALHQYEAAGDRMMAARVRLNLANLESDRARYESALAHGGRSLEEFRSLSAAGGEAEALHLIGEVYVRQGFIHKGLEYAQEALAVAKKINDKSLTAQSRVLLADIHGSIGDVEFASKMLKEAVEDTKLGVNRRVKANVLLGVARFRLAREASERAIQDAAQARKDYLEINDRRGVADCDQLMGMAHELRGDREQARSLLEKSLADHGALWDRYGEGRGMTALGVHHKNGGDHEKAFEYFGKALELRKGIGDRRGYAANLANMGILHRHRNELSEAQGKLEQALAIFRELSDKRGEADALTSLGNVDASRGSYAAAVEKLTTALKIHRDIRDTRGVVADLECLGRVHLARGDLDNATASLEEAERQNQRIRNPRGEIAVLSELAMVQRAKRNLPASLATLSRAVQLARQTNDTRVLSSIHLKMASVLEDSGDYQKALALLRETLESMKNTGDRVGEFWALGGIGIVQAKLEDYENALTSIHAALQSGRDLSLPAGQFRDLDFYLGEIYEGFRDLERAQEHYHKALSVSQTAGSDPLLGRLYDRIGNIYYRMEEYEKAREYLEDALRVHSENRNVEMQKAELIRLGDIAGKMGDPEAALKYQLKALSSAREGGDERTEARILTRIGNLNQILGRQRIAMEHYREAVEKRTRLGDRRGVSENLLQIALLASISGDQEAAVADLKRAFEIAQCSEDRSMLWKAYFIMGRTLEAKNSTGEALEAYRKAITVLESMEADIVEESDEDDFIFGGKRALFETTLRVLMQLARKDVEGAYDHQALRIVEKLKAASFESMLARINVAGFSDLPEELLIKEKSLKLALRRLNVRIHDELSKGNPDQNRMKKLLEERKAKETAFKALKDRLLKEYPSYAELRYPRPVTVHQLQRDVIDKDEAVLEFMVTRSRTYVFAMDKHRFTAHSIDYAGKDLERDVETLTKPLHRTVTQASWDPSAAYRLYVNLIKPVEYFLSGKKTVMIIPHAALCALPFEILVDSKAHSTKRFWSSAERPSYLLEKYAFCYTPSSSVLTHLRTRKRAGEPGWNLVAFGDAVYSETDGKTELNPGADRLMSLIGDAGANDKGGASGLKQPAGAKREILEISKIVGGSIQAYTGRQATESLFKRVNLSRYNYLHLAAHGVVLRGVGKTQSQPAVMFSLYGDKENDGFLQLGEVFGLKLNADLVVLSSCLSPGTLRVDESNGLPGLARAFLFAGADSVVLGMWPVSEEISAKIFVEMYRNLKSLSKAESLRQAKLTLVRDPGTSHPYYWAPFVLTGNWNVTTRPVHDANTPLNAGFKGLSTWRKLLSL